MQIRFGLELQLGVISKAFFIATGTVVLIFNVQLVLWN